MPSAKEIREQLLNSFRAELAEHIQVMTDGLLKIEQASSGGASVEQEVLDTTFRAAHSLKGAARAMGVTAIEQIAHAQESILDGLRRGTMKPLPEMFSTMYQALDAIQLVQAHYEAGETSPPVQALSTLLALEKVRSDCQQAASNETEQDAALAGKPAAEPAPKPEPGTQAVQVHDAPETNDSQEAQSLPASSNLETIRVDVNKLDSIMANLSELLIARMRLEQRRVEIGRIREHFAEIQRAWSPVHGAFSRLMREEENGFLSLHRPYSVDSYPFGNSGFTPRQRSLFRSPDTGVVAAAGELKSLVEISKDMSTLVDYVNASQKILEEIHGQLEPLTRRYAADIQHLSIVIDALEEDIKRLRMLPFNTIATTFTRLVRNLAHQSGKEANLTIHGGEIEVDKRVLEGLKDPLIHLLRNAIDHGIETPEARLAAGKPRAGKVVIAVERVGKDILVQVSDDGAGLDIEAIRQSLARSPLVRQSGLDPQAMRTGELVETIFSMGVSTSRMITDISGRGVGLNVVRNNIEALHGRINVDFQPGKGTVFSLYLPVELTSTHSLLIRSAGQLFAIPVDSIERTVRVDLSEIFTLEGCDVISYAGRPVPLVSLSEVLEMQGKANGEPAGPKRLTAIILKANERFDDQDFDGGQARLMAFIIDELAGEQEIIIKDLGKQLKRIAGISGGAVMGSGEVVLVLNADELMKLSTSRGSLSIVDTLRDQAESAAAAPQKVILVVDDSITTRTLEMNILEASGYKVLVATDGQEALEIIRTCEQLDLIVSDVVMPRVDGFELTRRIKENPKTAHLPVILVTSLESAEDKKRGIEVQADAYIVKNRFDQANLLETIEQLI